MDNRSIARVFGEIADFLEIKGENAFKIRAYRSAADVIGTWPDEVGGLDDTGLREIPGIGKDLAARVRELIDTGSCRFHQELLQQFPPSILELLRLQGVGPKTVAVLFSTLQIRSVEELAAAVRAGRLRGIKGMGAKKEASILRAIEERQRDTGRHLLADTAAMAADLVDDLRAALPGTEFVPVGSLRRGCETCGDIDILAIGGDRACMDRFVAYARVERVLGHGDTRASVRLQGGYQADLRLVAPESRGAALQYFTGSKAHNIAVRDRANARGYKLNEYGLFRVSDDERVAGEDEAGIYHALGYQWIPPELREHRGELEAAEAGTLPQLMSPEDLRGDLHMHTTETDGRHDLEAMAAAAARLGHEYIAVTEHSKALAMARGLDEHRALAHAARVRALNGRYGTLALLAGIECDILPDGRLDLADDCLAALDIVIASVHSHFSQDSAQMTDRILRALECPWVDVLGHPTGRLLLRRDGLQLDMDAIITAAARRHVALEINCQVDRLDLNDSYVRLARERGARLVISTDAHATTELTNQRWGVCMARRGWLEPTDVLNTRPLADLKPALRRHHRRDPPAAGQGC
jgi:DNA polymerase (family X)